MNATKAKAGKMGGLATVKKYGREYMATIGRRGAAALYRRYQLTTAGPSGWALIDRATGKVKAVW